MNNFNKNQEQILQLEIINKYKEVAIRMIRNAYPQVSASEIEYAVDYSIINHMKNGKAYIDNNYKHRKVDTTLLELSEYILKREPIITPFGVMFKKHAEGPNPIAKLLETFMNNRGMHKDEMFKYPKGSEEFEKYNLLQLLDKIDCNALYGAMGQFSCIYYNLNISSSVTTQGRSLISATGLQMEMFLGNNVKFGSLNEIVTFIDNICYKEKRKYDDKMILDRDITNEEVWYAICSNCGFNYIPSEKDLELVWKIICNLAQEDKNRIFYKNNLYNFMDNKVMQNALIYLLETLNDPFMDPNKEPKEIKVELEEFCSLIMEYVYYPHQIIDRMDRYANMYRSVAIITDTDSVIASLDGWYHYALEKVKGRKMKIMRAKMDAVTFLEKDEFGDVIHPISPIDFVEPSTDYDFYSDETIEMEKAINPITICPQEGLRYSIVNIMAYCLGKVINDYMVEYTKQSNSYSPDRKCLLILKNEFLFKRILLAFVKKNYASIQELQEGNIVPKNKQLDVKGLTMDKSGLNDDTREELKRIVYEQILMSDDIDEVALLKELAKFEKKILNSLRAGDKSYYKPVTVKSYTNYDDPMRIQGIKAALAWNALRDDGTEAIDLTIRNGIDIVKVDINKKNIEHLQYDNPELYEKIVKFMNSDKVFNNSIETVGVPKNVDIPEWIKEFIRYKEIINDNVKNIPLETLNIYRGNANNNYTNIISL